LASEKEQRLSIFTFQLRRKIAELEKGAGVGAKAVPLVFGAANGG
jgi:hypothetical protein